MTEQLDGHRTDTFTTYHRQALRVGFEVWVKTMIITYGRNRIYARSRLEECRKLWRLFVEEVLPVLLATDMHLPISIPARANMDGLQTNVTVSVVVNMLRGKFRSRSQSSVDGGSITYHGGRPR